MSYKYLVAATLAVAPVLGFGTAGWAQTPAPTTPKTPPTIKRGQSPIRFQMGLLIPTDSKTRSDIKKALINGGLTYDLPKPFRKHYTLSAYADVYGDDNRNETTGLSSKIFVFGVGPQLRRYINASQSPMRLYAGLGVGLYAFNAENEYRLGGFLRHRDGTSISVGTKLLGGLELKSGVFGEFGITSIGSNNTLNGSGLHFNLGFRL